MSARIELKRSNGTPDLEGIQGHREHGIGSDARIESSACLVPGIAVNNVRGRLVFSDSA
jgi:hypothetical protein